MLTGEPPLGHLELHVAIYKTGIAPLQFTFLECLSQDTKEFIKAALTWFVLLIAGISRGYLAK